MNPYLLKLASMEKVGLNRQEKYLLKNPLVDVERSNLLIQARTANRIANKLQELQGNPTSVREYRNRSRDLVRNNRGKPGITNVGLYIRGNRPLKRGALIGPTLGERLQKYKALKAESFIRTLHVHPYKMGLYGLGAATLGTAAGLGIKSLIDSSKRKD